MIKRIIDGKTYNTETSTRVAEALPENPHDYGMINDELYQTRHGAYFRCFWTEYDDDPITVQPLSPDQAQAWMEKHADTDLIEKHFGEMPEAGDSESRFTLRMPDSLKQRIDAAAKEKKQSTNAWIIRCLEEGIEQQAYTGEIY